MSDQEGANYWLNAVQWYAAECSKREPECRRRTNVWLCSRSSALSTGSVSFFNVLNVHYALSLYYSAVHLCVSEHFTVAPHVFLDLFNAS